MQLTNALVQSLALTSGNGAGQRATIFDPRNCESLPFSVGLRKSNTCLCSLTPWSGIQSKTADEHDVLGDLTLAAAQKEESRLMVWSAMTVLSAYASKVVEFNEDHLPLQIIDGTNVSHSMTAGPIINTQLLYLMAVSACSSARRAIGLTKSVLWESAASLPLERDCTCPIPPSHAAMV